MDSLANNWLDFEMNEIDFETFVVVMDEVRVAVKIDLDSYLNEFFSMIL